MSIGQTKPTSFPMQKLTRCQYIVRVYQNTSTFGLDVQAKQDAFLDKNLQEQPINISRRFAICFQKMEN